MTTKQDKSTEMKKGEIKQILIQTASEVLPDFEFLAYIKTVATHFNDKDK